MSLSKQRLIGIMLDNRKDRQRILTPYLQNHNLNIKLFAFTPADVLWQKRSIIGLSRQNGVWKQSTFPFPDAIHNRCYSNKSLTLQRMAKTIGRNKSFNSVTAFNKWTVYRALKQAGLGKYLPATYLYSTANISGLLNNYKQLYVKPMHGSRGMSVYRLEKMNNGEINISMHSIAPWYICRVGESIRSKMAQIIGQKKYLVQQGIRLKKIDNKFFDIRALVQKDISGQWKVSTIVSRKAYVNYFNTSSCESVSDSEKLLSRLYPPETVNSILKTLRNVSIKTAKAMEKQLGILGELSVDFALDTRNKLWIIELNGRPQKSIYKLVRGFQHHKRIYSRPMEYAFYLAQR